MYDRFLVEFWILKIGLKEKRGFMVIDRSDNELMYTLGEIGWSKNRFYWGRTGL